MTLIVFICTSHVTHITDALASTLSGLRAHMHRQTVNSFEYLGCCCCPARWWLLRECWSNPAGICQQSLPRSCAWRGNCRCFRTQRGAWQASQQPAQEECCCHCKIHICPKTFNLIAVGAALVSCLLPSAVFGFAWGLCFIVGCITRQVPAGQASSHGLAGASCIDTQMHASRLNMSSLLLS